jgi:hypothetical protein
LKGVPLKPFCRRRGVPLDNGIVKADRDGGKREAHALLTLRGLALLYIALHPGSTKREVAEALEVGDRTATTLIRGLSLSGAIKGNGGTSRRLHYEVNLNAQVEVESGRRTSLRSLLFKVAA